MEIQRIICTITGIAQKPEESGEEAEVVDIWAEGKAEDIDTGLILGVDIVFQLPIQKAKDYHVSQNIEVAISTKEE